jgi:lysophospholipase L1-like esterase
MVYKPVGIDESGNLPARARQAVAKASELTSTFAQAGLARWRGKLAANPAAAKIVFVGDSTSDPSTAASAIAGQLRNVHALAGEGLSGMASANIIMQGHNGVELDAWATYNSGQYPSDLKAAAPDLIVYSLGINTVRKGYAGTTSASLAASIKGQIDNIRADNPNADVVLRIPNPFTSDDVNANGWVTPNSSAQAYTDMLRDAYLSLVGTWPNVVVWNAQDKIFGRTSKPMESFGGLMYDQLHPSDAGYRAIADSLASDLIGLPRRYSTPAAQEPVVDMFSASRGVPPYPLGDTVQRADSTTSPGNASSGQAYTVSAGTVGVIGNRLYTPANSNSRATVNAGISDGEFGVTFSTLDAAASTNGLVFRYQDASNYLVFRVSANYWTLDKIKAGALTNLASLGGASGSSAKLRVVASGSSIECYKGGTLLFTVTESDFQTATGVGVQMNTDVMRAVDLYAKTP